MYTGTIAARYAKALLAFAAANDEEKAVYEQAEVLCDKYMVDSSVREILSAPVLPKSAKIEVVTLALGAAPCKSLSSFVKLVVDHRREKWLVFMMYAYRRLYEEKHRILRATLTTASDAEDASIDRITSLVLSKAGCKEVDVAHKRDDSIIGGFVLQIGDNLIDASLAYQLKTLRQRLSNKRIV